MTVYHGSYLAINEVDLSFCRREMDFGQGFYVTKIQSQAEFRASRKREQHKTQGVVTAFGLQKTLYIH